MSKAQLVITAVALEGRSKSEVARDYDVSRYWVQQLVHRYQTEGATAPPPSASSESRAQIRPVTSSLTSRRGAAAMPRGTERGGAL